MNILDFFKLPMQALVAICITCGLILFLPEPISDKLWLDGIRTHLGFVIGVFFLLTFAIILVSLLYTSIKRFNSYYNKRLFLKDAPDKLLKLDARQKVILLAIMAQINKTLELPIEDADVALLEYLKVIRKTTNQTIQSVTRSISFPYTLQPWAYNIINECEEDYFKSFIDSLSQYKSVACYSDDWLYEYAKYMDEDKLLNN